MTVRVTFTKLRIFHLNPTPIQISLFAGNFVRESEPLVVFHGQTLSLQDINFDGRQHNNYIDVTLALDKNGKIVPNPQLLVSPFTSGNAQITMSLSDLPTPFVKTFSPLDVNPNMHNFVVEGMIEALYVPSPPAGQPGGAQPGGQQPPAGQPGGAQSGGQQPGNGTIQFVNHTSHPIISLNIDNQGDLIQNESQIIPPNGWLDVTGVTAGNHVYAAENGFVSGGTPHLLLPLPVGTFSGNAGSVTINDPTVMQLLTQYGKYSAFVSEYWDANAIPHPAAFCFYDNSSYFFYDDNKLTDSGTYSLVSRQSHVYTVTFEARSNGDNQIGSYSYAGSMIGTLFMRNGPPSWPLIEYHRDGNVRCP